MGKLLLLPFWAYLPPGSWLLWAYGWCLPDAEGYGEWPRRLKGEVQPRRVKTWNCRPLTVSEDGPIAYVSPAIGHRRGLRSRERMTLQSV